MTTRISAFAGRHDVYLALSETGTRWRAVAQCDEVAVEAVRQSCAPREVRDRGSLAHAYYHALSDHLAKCERATGIVRISVPGDEDLASRVASGWQALHGEDEGAAVVVAMYAEEPVHETGVPVGAFLLGEPGE